MKTKQNTTQTQRRRHNQKKKDRAKEKRENYRKNRHTKKADEKTENLKGKQMPLCIFFFIIIILYLRHFFCTPFSRLVWKYLFVSFYSVHWASCWFCSLSIWMHKQIIHIYFYMYIFVTRDPSIQNVHWVRRTSGANKKIEINF